MTVVIDASVVVAALLDDGPAGRWAVERLRHDAAVAPHLLPAEVCSVVRRHVLAGRLPAAVGAQAIDELRDLGLDLVPFTPLQSRVWELRDTLTPYDAWYVAAAEYLDMPLATLDQRLVRANGPRCEFLTPRRLSRASRRQASAGRSL